jgi:hypothetical protein
MNILCITSLHEGCHYSTGILCRKTKGQYRNVPVPLAAYNLKSNVLLQKSFCRNESPLKLYWRIISHFSYKVSSCFQISPHCSTNKKGRGTNRGYYPQPNLHNPLYICFQIIKPIWNKNNYIRTLTDVTDSI